MFSRLTQAVRSRPLCLSALVALMVNLPALLTRFAVLDDYRKVLEFQRGFASWAPFNLSSGVAHTNVLTGRVIPAFIGHFVWPWVTSIQMLWLPRILAFSIILITSLFLANWTARLLQFSPFQRWVFAPVPVLLLLLPGSTAVITFASLSTALIALPMAVASGILLSRDEVTKRHLLGSLALSFGAAFSYQHFTFMLGLPLALWAAEQYCRRRFLPIRRLVTGLMFGVVALLANYAYLLLMSPDAVERVTGVGLFDRLTNLFTSYLPKSLHLWLEKSPQWFALSLALVIGVGAIGVMKMRQSGVYLLAALFSWLCVSLPTIAADGDSSYRLVFPAQFAIFFGLTVAFTYAHQAPAPGKWKSRLFGASSATALLLVTLVILPSSHETLNKRIALANSSDYRHLRCQLRNIESPSAIQTILLRRVPVSLTGDEAVYSEIGLRAIHVDWVLIDLYNILLVENPELHELRHVSVLVSDDSSIDTDNSSMTLIDLAKPCT
jgi:hypothetical protein